jgi:hypothetical protein
MEEFLGGFGGSFSSIFPTNKSRTTSTRPSTSTAYGYGYLNNPPPELEEEPRPQHHPQQRKMESAAGGGIKYHFEERNELIPMNRSSQQLVINTTIKINTKY